MPISQKRGFIALYYFCILFSLSTCTTNAQDKKIVKAVSSDPLSNIKIEQIAQKLQEVIHPSASLHKETTVSDQQELIVNRSNGTPRFILCKTQPTVLAKSKSFENFEKSAMLYLNSKKDLFQITLPDQEFKPDHQTIDISGNNHLRFAQFSNNLPIRGKGITFHFNTSGTLYSITANYVPTLHLQQTENTDSIKAITIVTNELKKNIPFRSIPEKFKGILNYKGPSASKCIWVDPISQSSYISWCVEIRPNERDNWISFVNISDGSILTKYNRTPNEGAVPALSTDANGKQCVIQVYSADTAYYMIDASRSIWFPFQYDILNDPKGAIWTVDMRSFQNSNLLFANFISYDNYWIDRIAVSAHYNAGVTLQYYLKTFNRKSFDNIGSTIMSVVHWPDYDGSAYDNAFWNGNYVAYGDGKVYKPFAAGLDVVAHELTHGVIQYTVALEYAFQSGALNESLADIFACMVDRNNWLIGEDIGYNGPLRNLEDPTLCNQPANMRNFLQCDISYDNGGVHYNSGIPNKAGFNLANQIGREKTERIFYQVLDARYLDGQSDFIDMRLAAIQAARDLFGENSNEVSAVEKAYDNVGIYQNAITVAQDLPTDGSNWVASIQSDAIDKRLVLIPLKSSDTSRKYLSMSKVFNQSSNPFSISQSRKSILFIDNSNNIRCINYDSKTESEITSGGGWSSIAFSPNESLIAANSITLDSSIYIFNLNDPSKCTVFNLNKLQNNSTKTKILYTDALNWRRDGQVLAFDCFCVNKLKTDTIPFWNIGLLDIQSGSFSFLNTNTTGKIHYANPSFSITTSS